MVLARFEQVLAENANAPLHLHEICSAINTAGSVASYACV
jgi:hypothetical protein